MRASRNSLVSILALTLVLCQLETAASAREPVLVDRAEKGYRIRAGHDWQVEQDPRSADAAIKLMDPPCSFVVVMSPTDGLIDDITDAHLKMLFRKTSAAHLKGVKVLLRKVETHGGKPSGWIEFIAEHKGLPGERLRIRQHFTLHRGNLYMIMVTTPYASWNKAKPHWVKVIRSMEFL